LLLADSQTKTRFSEKERKIISSQETPLAIFIPFLFRPSLLLLHKTCHVFCFADQNSSPRFSRYIFGPTAKCKKVTVFVLRSIEPKPHSKYTFLFWAKENIIDRSYFT